MYSEYTNNFIHQYLAEIECTAAYLRKDKPITLSFVRACAWDYNKHVHV